MNILVSKLYNNDNRLHFMFFKLIFNNFVVLNDKFVIYMYIINYILCFDKLKNYSIKLFKADKLYIYRCII